jgi:hypothetical protein
MLVKLDPRASAASTSVQPAEYWAQQEARDELAAAKVYLQPAYSATLRPHKLVA